MTESLPWFPVLAAGVIGVVPMIYATWWCVRTWSRIWEEPHTAYATIVYRRAVRGWGLAMWIIGLASSVIDAYQKHHDIRQAGVRLLIEGVGMFPLCLWLGHWWGRAMALTFGIENSRPVV